VIVAAFDAVLLLPAPRARRRAPTPRAPAPVRRSVPLAPRARSRLAMAVLVIGVAAVLRSAGQLAAMAAFSDARTAAQFERAARLDPGSYRIHMRLASLFEERGDCDRARESARAARDLYPNAPDPRRIIRACGTGPRAAR